MSITVVKVSSNDGKLTSQVSFEVGRFNHFCSAIDIYNYHVRFSSFNEAFKTTQGLTYSNVPEWFLNKTKQAFLEKLGSMLTYTGITFVRSDGDDNSYSDGYCSNGYFAIKTFEGCCTSKTVVKREGQEGEMTCISIEGRDIKAYAQSIKWEDPTTPTAPDIKGGLTKKDILAYLETM